MFYFSIFDKCHACVTKQQNVDLQMNVMVTTTTANTDHSTPIPEPNIPKFDPEPCAPLELELQPDFPVCNTMHSSLSPISKVCINEHETKYSPQEVPHLATPSNNEFPIMLLNLPAG